MTAPKLIYSLSDLARLFNVTRQAIVVRRKAKHFPKPKYENLSGNAFWSEAQVLKMKERRYPK